MKRLLMLVLFISIAGIASATSLNFQNPADNNSIRYVSAGSFDALGQISLIQNRTDYNNFLWVKRHQVSSYSGAFFVLNNPSQSTYAAATLVPVSYMNAVDSGYGGAEYAAVVLLDGSGNTLWSASVYSGSPTSPVRFEVKVVGGTASVFADNVLLVNSTPLAQNPSYIGFGTGYNGGFGEGASGWDDYTYGSSESTRIFGLPNTNGDYCFILKDIVNPASSGLDCNGVVVNSNFMNATWGRGNTSLSPGAYPNENISLVSIPEGIVYNTHQTGSVLAGYEKFDIYTYLTNTNAPMGYYAITTPGTNVYSNYILYKSTGASVAWGSKTYSTGDAATITYSIQPAYWDTSTYDYKVSIYSITEGWVGNTTLTASSGTISHQWSESNNPGVYLAWVVLTRKTDGTNYIVGSDYTTLSSYVAFSGYVNNAQTKAPISGSNVNMTQGSTVCNTNSAEDGSYNCTGFLTGTIWYVNATASGFNQYLYNNTPLTPKGVSLNISMEPTSPSYSGIGIGGVARDTTYGRPIENADVTVRNTTTAEYYVKQTSMTGWYICDNGASCSLQQLTPYDVWGHKIGFDNSTVYRAVTG